MSKIVNVSLDAIDPNPFRRLGEYSFIERKVEALVRSFEEIGMWEGVIAREAGNRYEIAFGHHRIEAADRAGLGSVDLIVRPLSDTEMLQYMGRENMEDYNADFLTMLETWEAAVDWAATAADKYQAVEIARLLGWTRARKDHADTINNTADACNAAYRLVQGGYVKRKDLHDMSVRTAREVLRRGQANMDRLEKMAHDKKMPAKEVKEAKKQIGKAVKNTLDRSRDGQIAQKDLAGEVDKTIYRHAKEAKKTSPLFAEFAKKLASTIAGDLVKGATADKLEEIATAVNDLTSDDDLQAVDRLRFELGQLSERSKGWEKRLIPNKVHTLKVTS